jgi:drug/metabolite transporter (DMT)-like permease
MSAPPTERHEASKTKLALAFAALYIVWGSTYLAIKFAIATIPPYLMSGGRFIVSGVILYLWARMRGAPNPTRREWRDGAVVGTLLLAGGNGAVGWAEQRVPSGITSLFVASVGIWMVLIDWARPHGKRPSLLVSIGLVIGLIGVGILAAPGFGGGANASVGVGAAVLILGSISWAGGSIYSRENARPRSAGMSTAIQMITGSIALTLIGLSVGEAARLDLTAVTLKSFLGWAYLVTFGSLIGFTAYAYVLRETTPAKATTYAYVNPIVAVLLGWAFADESITLRTVVAAGIILASVAMISLTDRKQRVGVGNGASDGDEEEARGRAQAGAG